MRQQKRYERDGAGVLGREGEADRRSGQEVVAPTAALEDAKRAPQANRHEQGDERVVDGEVRLANEQVPDRSEPRGQQSSAPRGDLSPERVHRGDDRRAEQRARDAADRVQPRRIGAELVDETVRRPERAEQAAGDERHSVFDEEQVLEERRIGERHPVERSVPDGERLQDERGLVRMVGVGQAERDTPQPQAEAGREERRERQPVDARVDRDCPSASLRRPLGVAEATSLLGSMSQGRRDPATPQHRQAGAAVAFSNARSPSWASPRTVSPSANSPSSSLRSNLGWSRNAHLVGRQQLRELHLRGIVQVDPRHIREPLLEPLVEAVL